MKSLPATSAAIVLSMSFLVGCARTPSVSAAGLAEKPNVNVDVREIATSDDPKASAGAAPIADDTATNINARPDEVTRQFYAWYLAELRSGHDPAHNDGMLKQYLTPDYVEELRQQELPKFDAVLGLPIPAANWSSMRVKLGKSEFYHEKGVHGAYITVRYSGYNDRLATQKKGFVSIPNEWSIGLDKTASGWRIASIGLGDL